MPGKNRKDQYAAPVCFLLVAVFLRSLVAPGYMLDPGTTDAAGLTITLCGGLNGINKVPGMEHTDAVPAGHHRQHQATGHETQAAYHMHHESGDDGYQHEEQHFTAACGLWSASGTFITLAWNEADRFQIVHLQTVAGPRIDLPTAVYSPANPARAPPALLIT